MPRATKKRADTIARTGKAKRSRNLSKSQRAKRKVELEVEVESGARRSRFGPEPTTLTPEKREQFIRALREDACTVGEAAERTGLSTGWWYTQKGKDKEFAAEWEAAWSDGNHVLEREAIRRAVYGTEKPIFYKGKEVARIREYSDVLLIFMMKARQPDRFREQTDVKLQDGGIVAAFAAAVRRAAT